MKSGKIKSRAGITLSLPTPRKLKPHPPRSAPQPLLRKSEIQVFVCLSHEHARLVVVPFLLDMTSVS